MSALEFPIAMFAGTEDLIAERSDVAWTHKQLKNQTIFFHEYYLGHMSFAIAKDKSWFTVDVMSVVNHYNQKCDVSTAGSNFQEGN